jgi:hypothetical protein
VCFGVRCGLISARFVAPSYPSIGAVGSPADGSCVLRPRVGADAWPDEFGRSVDQEMRGRSPSELGYCGFGKRVCSVLTQLMPFIHATPPVRGRGRRGRPADDQTLLYAAAATTISTVGRPARSGSRRSLAGVGPPRFMNSVDGATTTRDRRLVRSGDRRAYSDTRPRRGARSCALLAAEHTICGTMERSAIDWITVLGVHAWDRAQRWSEAGYRRACSMNSYATRRRPRRRRHALNRPGLLGVTASTILAGGVIYVTPSPTTSRATNSERPRMMGFRATSRPASSSRAQPGSARQQPDGGGAPFQISRPETWLGSPVHQSRTDWLPSNYSARLPIRMASSIAPRASDSTVKNSWMRCGLATLRYKPSRTRSACMRSFRISRAAGSTSMNSESSGGGAPQLLRDNPNPHLLPTHRIAVHFVARDPADDSGYVEAGRR